MFEMHISQGFKRFFILRCLRPEAHYAIFSHLELQLTNQLEPVEEFTDKTGVKGLSEKELGNLINNYYLSMKYKL